MLTQMQPWNWLKTKKKIMDQTQTDSHNHASPFFAFNHTITSKKLKNPRAQLSHVFSTPLIGTIVRGEQTKEEGKSQWMNMGEENPEPEAELENSLKGLKVSHEETHIDEAHYDPEQIFALLNSAKKPAECVREEQKQNEKEGEQFDSSQQEDKISIFTFAAKESKRKQIGDEKIRESQKNVVKKKQTLREYRQTRIHQAHQKSQSQNPLLYLNPRDFQAINGDSTQLQLLFTKRQNPFFKRYCQKSYEPRHKELRQKLKEEMLGLMHIRQGSYLANVVLGEVLEECLKVEKEEKELDGRIEEFQLKLKEGLNSLCERDQEERHKGDGDKIQQVQYGKVNGSKESALSEKKARDRSTRSSIIRDCMSDGKSEKNQDQEFVAVGEVADSVSFNVAQQIQQQQSQIAIINEQIQMLKAQIQRQQAILHQETQAQVYLQRLYHQQQTSLHQAISHKQLVLQQLHSTQSRLSLRRQNLKTAIINQQQASTSLKEQLQKCLQANNSKLNLMLENLFDVLYVQLQILANKILKNADKPKWKLNSQIDKQTQETQLFIEFYQVYLDQGLLICDNDFVRHLDEALSEFLVQFDSRKYTHLYQQFEKCIKAYICFIIESSRTKHNSNSSTVNLSFSQQLFNLLDTNSYHSQTVKQGFFKLSKHFAQYGQGMFGMLLQDVMGLGQRNEGEMGKLLIGIDGKEEGGIDGSMEQFVRWLEGLVWKSG